MKKLLFLFVMVVVIFSCKKDEEERPQFSVEGEWELVESRIPFTTPEEGDELPFEETYIFRGDGSFEKNRITEGQLTTAIGTYKVEDPGPNQAGVRKNVILTFEVNIA